MSDNIVAAAMNLRQQGDNQGAILLYQQHLSTKPNDVYALHNISAALGDEGRFDESARYAKRAIDAGLNKAQTHLVYARALAGINRFDDATAAYQAVLKQDLANIDAHKELCQLVWMQTGDKDHALKAISQLIDDYPNAINLIILRAKLHGQMGDAETQFAQLQACYGNAEPSPVLDFHLSKAALASKRYEVALKHAEIAAQAFSNDLHCAIHKVNCLLANGLEKPALEIITHWRNQAPNNQHLIALQASCWRLLDDARYKQLYNYDAFVKQYSLGVPKGWNTLEHYLNDLEQELDEEHQFREHPFFLSVRHGSQLASITSSNKTAMRAFSEAIQAPLAEYLKQLGSSEGVLQARNTGKAKIHSAWSVKLYPDGYHVNHVHQEGWLSSACHIRLYENTSEQDNAGWLKFGEPGPITKPALSADKIVKPERGKIVIFPSYMWHGTIPFSGKNSRLTVATDLVPK